MKKYALPIALFFAFIVFTICVKTVDVAPIGPMDSEVGFSSINGAIAEKIGENQLWYDVTEILGFLSLAVAGCFAFVGVYQFIKRKSLLKVDREILALGGFYAVVLAFYVLFEKIVINYRPVILEEVLEASYPSSHTMLSLCIMLSALYLINHYFKENKKYLYVIDTVLIVIAVVTVVGRLLSGVHWFTDIVGGVLLSLALVSFYKAFITKDSE